MVINCRSHFVYFAFFFFFSTNLHAIDLAETAYRTMGKTCPVQPTLHAKDPNCRFGEGNADRLKQLKAQSDELAQDSELSSLAADRSRLLACSEKQISDLEQNPDDFAKMVEDYSAKLIRIGSLKRQMQTLLPAITSDPKAKDAYTKARELADSIKATLSYSKIKPMEDLINYYTSQLDMYPDKGPEDWFVDQMKKDVATALNHSVSKINEDIQILDAGAKNAEALNLYTRESLAQDEDLVMSFNKSHPELVSNGVACMVDAKYGQGAKYRDNAILISGGIVTIAMGAGELLAPELMASISEAAALGSIPRAAAPIIRAVATSTTVAANVTQAIMKCSSSTLSATAIQGKKCESIVKTVEDQNCYLSAAISAVGIIQLYPGIKTVTGKFLKYIAKSRETVTAETQSSKVVQVAKNSISKTDEILAKNGLTREDLAIEKAKTLSGGTLQKERTIVARNGALKDEDRFKKIKQDFKNLNDFQIKCIIDEIHHGIGGDKAVYQYSKEDIFQKARKLKSKCKIASLDDIDALIRLGYAGKVPVGAGEKMTQEESDFERLLRNGSDVAVPKTVVDVENEYHQLTTQYQQTKGLLDKVKIQEQMDHLATEHIEQELRENPNILSDLLKKGFVPKDETSSVAQVTKSISLSNEKKEALVKNGMSELEANITEIKTGDEVGFKSSAYGNGFGEIVGVDPQQTGHLIVKVVRDGKVRNLSFSQTELMMTQSEKAHLVAELSRRENASKILSAALNKNETATEATTRLVNDLANQLGRTGQSRRTEEIELRLAQFDNDPNKFTNAEYHQLVAQHRKLSSLEFDDKRILKALRLINPNNPHPPAEYQDLIAQAKKNYVAS